MLMFRVLVTVPFRFNDNNNGKKMLSAEQNYLHPGVSAKFVFTPFVPVLLHITAKPPPLRWTKYGLLSLTQRSDQRQRFFKHTESKNGHEGRDLNYV